MTNTGGKINTKSTKFMGINTDSTDQFKLGDDYITRTQSYCYIRATYRAKRSPSKLKKRLSTSGNTRGSSVASYVPITDDATVHLSM